MAFSSPWSRAFTPKAPLDPSQARVGLEMEIFVLDRLTLTPLGSTTRGVRCTPQDLLHRLSRLIPFSRILKDGPTGEVVGLWVPWGGQFTLEPSGHIEYSSSPCQTWKILAKETQKALTCLSLAGQDQMLFLSHGTYPFASHHLSLAVPKQRYQMLDRYLASEPHGRGIHMMRGTASLQPNLDIPSFDPKHWQRDWERIVKCVDAISPLTAQIFSNSYYFNGGFVEKGGERQNIWDHMDKSRTGSFFHNKGVGTVDNYVEWAQKAYVWSIPGLPLNEQPLYGQLTFAQWADTGFKGTKPLVGHWAHHLATLFPDVRLRGFVEVRNVDAQPFAHTLAPMVFWHILTQTRSGQKRLEALCQGGGDVMDGALAAAQDQCLDDEVRILSAYKHEKALPNADQGITPWVLKNATPVPHVEFSQTIAT